jgi:hypothetical protein
MAIGRALRSLLVGSALALGLGAAGCTVSLSSAPAEPAFDTDVRPIFLAHCVRCHGAGPDGGLLNVASVPGVDYGSAPPLETTGPCLNQFNGNPDAGGQFGCRGGAATSRYLTELSTYVKPGYPLRMPPPPAPVLNDWELAVIDAWVAENPPICSRSSNPDPALRCD